MPDKNKNRKSKTVPAASFEIQQEWDFYSIAKTMMQIAGGLLLVAFVLVASYGMGTISQRNVFNDNTSARSFARRSNPSTCAAYKSNPGMFTVNIQTTNDQITPFITDDGNAGAYVGWINELNLPWQPNLQQLDEDNNLVAPQEIQIDNTALNKINPTGVLTSNKILANLFATQPPSADVYLDSFVGLQQQTAQSGYVQKQQVNYFSSGQQYMATGAARTDGGIDTLFQSGSSSYSIAARRLVPNTPGGNPVNPLDAKDVFFTTTPYSSYLNINPSVALNPNQQGAALWQSAANSSTNYQILVRFYDSNNLTAINFLDAGESVLSLPGHDARYPQIIYAAPIGFAGAYIDTAPGNTFYTPTVQLSSGAPMFLSPMQMTTTNGFTMTSAQDWIFLAASSKHENIPGLAGRLFGKQIWFNGTLVNDLFILDPSNSTTFAQTNPASLHRGKNRISFVYENNTNDPVKKKDINIITLNDTPYLNIQRTLTIAQDSDETFICGGYVEPFYRMPQRIDCFISAPPGTATLTGADADGVLHIWAESSDSVNDFNMQMNSIGLTPQQYYNGLFNITYRTSKDNGTAVNRVTQVNVTKVEVPPVFLNNSLTIVQDGRAKPVLIIFDPDTVPAQELCSFSGIVALIFQQINSQNVIVRSGLTDFSYNISVAEQLWAQYDPTAGTTQPAYTVTCGGVSSTAEIYFSLKPNPSNAPSSPPSDPHSTPNSDSPNSAAITIGMAFGTTALVGFTAYLAKRFGRNDWKRDHDEGVYDACFFANRVVVKAALNIPNFRTDDTGVKFLKLIAKLTDGVQIDGTDLTTKLKAIKDQHNWFYDFSTRSPVLLVFLALTCWLRQAHEKEVDKYAAIFIRVLEQRNAMGDTKPGVEPFIKRSQNCTSWIYKVVSGRTLDVIRADTHFVDILREIQAIVDQTQRMDVEKGQIYLQPLSKN